MMNQTPSSQRIPWVRETSRLGSCRLSALSNRMQAEVLRAVVGQGQPGPGRGQESPARARPTARLPRNYS